MILRPFFCFKDTKNTGLLIFNSLKQKKLIFNFVVNRNWKKLTDSRKRAKILADNRKSYHPIETLLSAFYKIPRYLEIPLLYKFVKLRTEEDIYPKNTKRKAFQKKRPNRDEIRFRTKTIVTSLPRTFTPIGQKIIS